MQDTLPNHGNEATRSTRSSTVLGQALSGRWWRKRVLSRNARFDTGKASPPRLQPTLHKRAAGLRTRSVPANLRCHAQKRHVPSHGQGMAQPAHVLSCCCPAPKPPTWWPLCRRALPGSSVGAACDIRLPLLMVQNASHQNGGGGRKRQPATITWWRIRPVDASGCFAQAYTTARPILLNGSYTGCLDEEVQLSPKAARSGVSSTDLLACLRRSATLKAKRNHGCFC